MTDYLSFDEIDNFVAEGDGREEIISEQYEEGLITEDERYTLTVNNWRGVDKKVEDFLKKSSPRWTRALQPWSTSGARGNVTASSLQVR